MEPINPAPPVINGIDLESDANLRDRIKSTIQSLSKGTTKALINGVVGIVDPDDNKRVVSANLIDATNPTDIAKLVIDDGTGFEPSFEGRGFETVVEDATGGEEFIQLVVMIFMIVVLMFDYLK